MSMGWRTTTENYMFAVMRFCLIPKGSVYEDWEYGSCIVYYKEELFHASKNNTDDQV